MADPIRICFVCLGNIVRSPLAENMFRHLAEQRGRAERYTVESAGTSSWHVGESPDPRMRQVAARHGLRYDGSARQFRKDDFERFDLVVAMDASNRAHLLDLTSQPEHAAKIRLLREFDPEGGQNEPVPDPYYGGIEGFERTFQIVERSCQSLLDRLEQDDLHT